MTNVFTGAFAPMVTSATTLQGVAITLGLLFLGWAIGKRVIKRFVG